MIRVVLDTNVYVSAILFGGTCEAILALARAGAAQVEEALAEVNSLASLVRSSVRLTHVISHPPDVRVLECAVAAQADFLVTGDKRHLQPLKQIRGVQIVSPRQFLNLLRER